MVPFSEKRAEQKSDRQSATVERRRERRRTESARASNKVAAKRRDGYRCRYPNCQCQTARLPLESAHIRPLSLVGSDQLANLLTLCGPRHRGRLSLHSGDLIVKAGAHGANGAVDFYLNGIYVGTTEPGARR